MTATVTHASANVVYEMIRVVGQPLGGTGKGQGLLQGGPSWQGSKSLGKLCSLHVVWLGGQLSPPLLCPALLVA